MKTFEYEGRKYELTTLIKHHYDETLPNFKEGVVTDLNTGEEINIANLFYDYKEKVGKMLENSKNFSSSSEYSRIKNIYETQVKNIKTLEYQSKLDNDSITLEEIEDWLNLMTYKDRSSFGIVKYNNYITINHAKPKPKGLNRNDYSRFFELIYLMNYENNISHSNGKPIKRETLASLLEFESISGLDNFISKLKKYNMIIKTEPNYNNVSFIMINPAYAMRQMEIDLTTYNYFKSDLDELLSPLERKYINLKANKQKSYTLSIDNNILCNKE